MTAAALIADLHARGLRLWAELHLVPRRLLTDNDRAALRANKPAVLALLADLEELERDGMALRLRTIARTLTAEEHQRLAAEAVAGDRLAALMVAVRATAGERVEVLRWVGSSQGVTRPRRLRGEVPRC